MNVFYRYVKSEWIYWVFAAAIFLLSGFAKNADAQPVPYKAAAGMSFYKDASNSEWTIRFKNVPTAMDESFADIDVIWRGSVEGNPLVLIAGIQAGQCYKTYRLYWGQNSGDIRQAKFTDICNAKDVKVDIYDSLIRLSFDGKVKRVPLD